MLSYRFKRTEYYDELMKIIKDIKLKNAKPSIPVDLAEAYWEYNYGIYRHWPIFLLKIAIINEMFKNKYITIPELAIKVNKSEPTIHRHIDVLVSKGYIKRVGSRKIGYWENK